GLKSFTYGTGVGYVNENSMISTHNVAFSVTAEVESDSAEGVIAAQGGGTSGWSLYVKGGLPTFHYNFFDVARYSIQSCTPLPKGKSTVRVELTPEVPGVGKPAAVKLLVNGEQV